MLKNFWPLGYAQITAFDDKAIAVPPDAVIAIHGDWYGELVISSDGQTYTPLRNGALFPPSAKGFVRIRKAYIPSVGAPTDYTAGGRVTLVYWPIDAAAFLNFDTTRANACANVASRAPTLMLSAESTDNKDNLIQGGKAAITDVASDFPLTGPLLRLTAESNAVYVANKLVPGDVLYLPPDTSYDFHIPFTTTVSVKCAAGKTATLWYQRLA